MTCSNDELIQFEVELLDIANKLLEYKNKFDYPIGTNDGIALNLMIIVTEIRDAIKNSDHYKYNTKYITKCGKNMNQAIKDFQARMFSMNDNIRGNIN